MNGEDLDMTNKVGRVGYRVILDPKVMVYEDTPYSIQEYREQRTRWSRAGVHCFARFSPFSSGIAGPRTWYMFPRLFATRFLGPLRLIVVMHSILVAIFQPGYRNTILIVLALYVAASAPTLVVAFVLLIRYNFASKLPWLIAWYPYQVLRRFVVLEGLLSLPTRPVEVRAHLARWAGFSARLNASQPTGEPA
jgi:cellulose synthase/poly-beta-1,6-N-acetylglucosamine synthase-like glycosyltransferase